jgi:hypothetical protein
MLTRFIKGVASTPGCISALFCPAADDPLNAAQA